MTDKLTPEQRRRCMSSIRSTDTKPEIIVRKFLFNEGFRYRLHTKKLPGSPDIVLAKYKTVIFINGCFWHGHKGCKKAELPQTRTDWWQKKINTNIEGDNNNYMQLKALGWHIIIIWECQLKTKVRVSTLTSLSYTLNHLFLINYQTKQ